TVQVPLASGNGSSGVFSLAFRDQQHGVAVGGDYRKPDDAVGTAAFSSDGGLSWTPAQTAPHGYRSAVAWDSKAKAWVTVGTNGSDISYDDGKTWQPLDNGEWNALSLPWVVGPKGRIGKLVSLNK
ncbi:MAG TPA: glycosyl hydrolase, partial [Acidobacteriaceae bacterium]